MGWRARTDIQTLEAILDEIKRISWDINLESGYILIARPKEGLKDFGKYAYLDDDDVSFIKSMPIGMPFMYFFRHQKGRSGIKPGDQFGPKYFKTWWDKACKGLGVQGVGLYGGTKHTVATALGQLLTPEEIRRGGTGSRTNKAFDRYFQPQRQERLKVKNAIANLKENARDQSNSSVKNI